MTLQTHHRVGAVLVWTGLFSLLACLCLGCGESVSSEWMTHSQAVIRGQSDSRHPAVGALVVRKTRSFCTATLIAPRLVLTASHCVDAFGQAGGLANIQFRVESAQGFTYHSIAQATRHPKYVRKSSTLYYYDIAVLVLSRDLSGVTPIPVNTQALNASWVGQNVLVMGYGLVQVSPQPIAARTKQSALIPIFQVSTYSFIHYDQQTSKSACHGDSGGPALMQVQGQWRVVGVTSVAYKARRNPKGNPATLCDGGTRDTRPDVHYQSFLLPFLQQYGGGSTTCANGQTRACYGGPPSTRGVGACQEGLQSCQGGKWGDCTGAVLPAATDSCGDQIDNNCNGLVDENCPSCTEGVQKACYTGSSQTRGVGACRDGIQTCLSGRWSACSNPILPAPQETCFDQIDNNCNGQVDEGCPDCKEGATQTCYTGPAATLGVGACQSGTQTCQGGAWGGCVGQVLPEAKETCLDNTDNNCNGQVDEGCVKPECTNGETQACYSGAPGTLNVGLCRAGIQSCSSGKWSPCNGEILPKPEVCDRLDNNCDGAVDEICQKPQDKKPSLRSTLRPSGFGCGGAGSLSLVVWLLGFFLSMRLRKQHPLLSL